MAGGSIVPVEGLITLVEQAIFFLPASIFGRTRRALTKRASGNILQLVGEESLNLYEQPRQVGTW